MAATNLPYNDIGFLAGWHKNMLLFFIQNYRENDAEMMVSVYLYGLRPELREELHRDLVKNPHNQNLPIEWRNIVARAYDGIQKSLVDNDDVSVQAQRSQKLVEEASKALADEQGRVAELTKQLADAKKEVAVLKNDIHNMHAEFAKREYSSAAVPASEPDAPNPTTATAATTAGGATEPDELTKLLQGDDATRR